MQALAGINIVYADKDHNIFYLSNGLFPYRNPDYDWKKVLPGDTSATLWDNNFYPVEDLPQVLNPECGYVFNTNNTPFNATCPEENLDPDNFDKTMGFHRFCYCFQAESVGIFHSDRFSVKNVLVKIEPLEPWPVTIRMSITSIPIGVFESRWFSVAPVVDDRVTTT